MHTVLKRIMTTLTILSVIAGTAFGAGQGEAEAVAETADTPEPVTVRFAEVAWTDIVATTASTRLVLEAIGYDTTAVMVAVPMAYEGMAGGDVDVFLGNWMPSMATIANRYFDEGTVIMNRANLEGAKYTLATPTYMAEQGLTSFADIADFAEELDSTIHGIEPGNDGNQLILDMIAEDAFGLGDFSLAESSEAGMLAEAQARAQQEEPIVFLGWAPHPMNNYLDMEYLSGGDDYFGPDYGAATVYTNTRAGFLEAYPNLERFFDNLYFTLEMEGAIMGAIDDGIDAEVAAEEWLRENPAILEDWFDGVQDLDGNPALETVRAELGI